jgi:hypothetical protein
MHHDDPVARPTASTVRPYLLTGGRARPDTGLEIETQVLTTPAGDEAVERYRYEQHDIILLCRQPRAVAEVAARLGLHLDGRLRGRQRRPRWPASPRYRC